MYDVDGGVCVSEGGNTMTVAVQLDGVESTLEFFDPVERTVSSSAQRHL